MSHPWVMLDKLGGIVLDNVKGCIVEIGVGESTKILAYFSKLFDRPFYTCDSNSRRCKWIEDTILCKNMRVFHMTSYDFMKQFDDVPALVLIDGEHRAQTVRTEANFFIEKMAVGGVMFLHDTCPLQRTWEAKKRRGKVMDTYLVRKELEQREDVDCLTWRYTAANCGLTMVLKKDMNEPEYRT